MPEFIPVTDDGREGPAGSYAEACAWLDREQPHNARNLVGFEPDYRDLRYITQNRHRIRHCYYQCGAARRYRNYTDIPQEWQAVGRQHAEPTH